MKSNGMGGMGRNGIRSYAECLRFISGATMIDELERNVATLENYRTPETGGGLPAHYDGDRA